MATEIPLTQGQVAIVDDADAEWLRRWSWCASKCHGGGRFVAVRAERVSGSKRTVYMHREVMGLSRGAGLEVDHINHDVLDNRRQNLRVVTPTQNKRWIRSREGSSSAFVGVTWDSARDRWRAQIQVAGRVLNLGRYATEVEAARARDRYVRDNRTGHVLNFVGHG